MASLVNTVSLLVALSIVGLLNSVNAYKHHGKQDGSEECDEWGRPLKDKEPTNNSNAGERFMDELWPMKDNTNKQPPNGHPPGFIDEAFWDEINQAIALMTGDNFGIKNSWQADWNLQGLEKEMSRRMMSPSLTDEMKRMFINKQQVYRNMMEKRLENHRRLRGGKHAAPIPPYKLVTIILVSLMAVVFIMAVGVMLYKRKVLRSRSAVAPPTPEKIRKYMEQEENIDGGKGPLPTCPAYMIAGAAPPVYTMADVPDEGGVYDNAPPTYSTIDLQDAAADVTVVNVKPV